MTGLCGICTPGSKYGGPAAALAGAKDRCPQPARSHGQRGKTERRGGSGQGHGKHKSQYGGVLQAARAGTAQNAERRPRQPRCKPRQGSALQTGGGHGGLKENEKRKRKRGASTISQQTAKNVFLWPQSSWLRKGFEVYFTWMIELFWSKERIMTVYLNSIEMGKGIYGAQAAARYKFHTTAAKLSAGQCALIAATLPNPIRFDSAHPSSYILKRQGCLRPVVCSWITFLK